VFFFSSLSKNEEEELSLPRRSHDSKPSEPRPAQVVVREREPESRSCCYTSFVEFRERTKSLKPIGDWCVKLLEDKKVFKKMVEPYLLPEVEINYDLLIYSSSHDRLLSLYPVKYCLESVDP